MNWAFWVIPLIGLAVWILSTIFRDLDERMEKERRARSSEPSRDEGGRLAARTRQPPPVVELDRFLEEARQKRNPSARPRRPAKPRNEPIVVQPQSEEVARRRDERSPGDRPVPTQRQAEPGDGPRQAAGFTAAPPDAAQPTFANTKPPEAAVAAQVASLPPRPAPPESPGLKRLKAMLCDRTSLGTAFLFRELFEPPVALRRR